MSSQRQSFSDWPPITPASTSSTSFSLNSMNSTSTGNAPSPSTNSCDSIFSSSPSQASPSPEVRCTCGKIFRGFSCFTNMQRHQKISKLHNTNPGYWCPHCSAKFTRSDNLNFHVHTHSEGSRSSTGSWLVLDADDAIVWKPATHSLRKTVHDWSRPLFTVYSVIPATIIFEVDATMEMRVLDATSDEQCFLSIFYDFCGNWYLSCRGAQLSNDLILCPGRPVIGDVMLLKSWNSDYMMACVTVMK